MRPSGVSFKIQMQLFCFNQLSLSPVEEVFLWAFLTATSRTAYSTYIACHCYYCNCNCCFCYGWIITTDLVRMVRPLNHLQSSATDWQLNNSTNLRIFTSSNSLYVWMYVYVCVHLPSHHKRLNNFNHPIQRSVIWWPAQVECCNCHNRLTSATTITQAADY